MIQAWIEVCHFLVAEKYKPYEIYWRMWCLRRNIIQLEKKMFTNELGMGLRIWGWIKKVAYNVMGNPLFFSLVKKKFKAQQTVKVILTVFWNSKGPITNDFLEKGATVCSTPLENFTLFMDWLFVFMRCVFVLDIGMKVSVCQWPGRLGSIPGWVIPKTQKNGTWWFLA